MDLTKIKKELQKLDSKKKIRFIVLFGSVAEKRETPLSDVDIAVYYDAPPAERFKFRIKALGILPSKVDLQIFQDLPLTVRKSVLAGKPLYYDNFQFIFDEYMKVIREYDSFQKYHELYINKALEVEA